MIVEEDIGHKLDSTEGSRNLGGSSASFKLLTIATKDSQKLFHDPTPRVSGYVYAPADSPLFKKAQCQISQNIKFEFT